MLYFKNSNKITHWTWQFVHLPNITLLFTGRIFLFSFHIFPNTQTSICVSWFVSYSKSVRKSKPLFFIYFENNGKIEQIGTSLSNSHRRKGRNILRSQNLAKTFKFFIIFKLTHTLKELFWIRSVFLIRFCELFPFFTRSSLIWCIQRLMSTMCEMHFKFVLQNELSLKLLFWSFSGAKLTAENWAKSICCSGKNEREIWNSRRKMEKGAEKNCSLFGLIVIFLIWFDFALLHPINSGCVLCIRE